MNDKEYMQLAIDIAKRTKGQTSLNPVVGAVVVNNERIVGIGTHLKAGDAHAEIFALDMSGNFAEDSTLYVTLEPCSHYGKTPPCVEKIIAKKVKKVVVATLDANPVVAGNGIKTLKEAGIEVEIGILEEEARSLNEHFNKYIVTGIPFITVKTAMTLDGKIASITGSSKWITSENSRAYVHKLRHENDAIMVGIGTILTDNPSLTVRPKGLNPIRIVIDTQLKIPLDANVINDNEAPTWIFTTNNSSKDKIEVLKSRGVKVVIVKGESEVNLKEVLKELGDMGVTSLLVEGGSKLLGSLFDEKLIDKYICFIAPKLIGGALSSTPIGGKGITLMENSVKLKNLSFEKYDNDICIEGYPMW